MKIIRKKWKWLLPLALTVALMVPLVAIPAIAQEPPWDLGITCPGTGDCSAGCNVDGFYIDGFGEGKVSDGTDVFSYPAESFNFTLHANGYTQNFTTTADEVSTLAVTIDETRLCCMHIDMPDDMPAEARVRIKGAGDKWEDDNCICLPLGVDITWSLILGNFESQTYTKHVDCSPLVVGEAAQPSYCQMKIQMPDEIANEFKVRVENSGKAWGNGETVCLPVSNTVNWRLETFDGKFVGEWYQKHVDCTPLEVLPCQWCAMRILMPYDVEEAGGRVRIENAGDQWHHGDVIYLPKCIFINWSLITDIGSGHYEGPVYKKHVDCTPLEAGCAPTFCTMQIEMPEALQEVGAVVRIESSGQDFEDGDTAVLPISETIRWRLMIQIGSKVFEGDWYEKHVDCTPLVVPTNTYCTFTAKPGKDHTLRVEGTGYDFNQNDQFILPKSISFRYRIDDSSWIGPTNIPPCSPTDLKP